MSASSSSTQHPVETKEAVKDVKATKPPIKPKPFVPPKPKQAFISTNSENKGPPLSPGPCSPTTDIPSAFKISQLTGPQPYGARRTSLRRWSSSVGEEAPLESNTLLSPVENVMPELYNKVTTQPLAAAGKHLQTGSVWKGKSPFMLTTRGWGEQKSQGKDIHESESFPQKPSVNSKDVNLKETVPKGNTVVNSSSHSGSISPADHKEVHTNVQDLKPKIFSRAPEEVKKTPLEESSSGISKKIEISAPDNEPKKSQESSDSPQTDIYFGITKQSTQCEPNKPDTKAVDFSDQSGHATTESTQDNDGASVQRKNSPKDIERPQLIPPVPKPRPRSNILVKENTKTIEESPSSDLSNLMAHEVCRHQEDRSNNIPELKPEIPVEKDTDSIHLQTSPSQIRVVHQNQEQGILPKLETGEKHAISSMTQITDKPLTKNDHKESTASTEQNLQYTAEDYPVHDGKTEVPSDNHNKPYHEDKIVSDMQPPTCTARTNEIDSKGQEATCTQVHDYNIEEDQPKNSQHEFGDTIRDPSKNSQHEDDDTTRDPSTNRQHKHDDTLQDQLKDSQHVYEDTVQEPSKNRQHEYDGTVQELSKNRHEYDITVQEPSKNREHECDDTVQEPFKNRQHEYDDTVQEPSKNRQHEYDGTVQDPSKNRHEYDGTVQEPSKNRQHEGDYTIQDPSNNGQHENDDTKRDPSKNSQCEYVDTVQTGEYVPYQTSEEHTEYPGDYRFFENNEGLPYYSKTPSAPELPGPTDTETIANLCVGSQILMNSNQISGDLFSHSADESKEPSHSMEKDDQPRKPHEGLIALQRHGSSRPEMSYDESQFRYSETASQDPVVGDELSDHNEQSDLLEYYTSQSPIINEHEVHSKKTEFRADELHMPQHGNNQSQEQEFRDALKVELDYKRSDVQVHKYEQSEEPDYKYQELEKAVHKYEQPDKSNVKYEQFEESDQRSEPSKEPEYTYGQSPEPMSRYQQPWGSDLKDKETDKSTVKSEQLEESNQISEPSKELESTYEQSPEPMSRYQQPWGSDLKDEETDKSTVKSEKSEESHNRSESSEEPEYTYEQSQEPMSRYQQPWGSDLKDEQTDKSTVKSEQLEESDQRSEPSKEPEYTYEQSQEPINRWGSEHKYDQTEESGPRHETLEHEMDKYELLEQPSYRHEKSEEAVHKNDQLEEFVHVTSPPDQNLSSNKYKSPEESEHRYAYFEEKVHAMEELKYPVHNFEQLDEPSEYEQTTKPIQGYQSSEKPVYRFTESEEIIHDQSQEPDYRYVQYDESAHCDELVNQRERTEDPTYVHTGSDAKNSQVGPIALESLQHQYKLVPSDELDSNISTASCEVDVKRPEKAIIPSESDLRNSHIEKPTCNDSSIEETHDSKKTLEEQVHEYALPGGQQLQGVHEEETRQSRAESEEDEHVDDFTDGSRQESPAVKTDDTKPKEIQDQEAKTNQVLNGHAEHSVDSTSDVVKDEPEETQVEEPNEENFDFLEGTVVLDSSFMRGKASLGKKRGHRIPVGTCEAEEKDPEYWMFRDSTEPKIISEKQSDEDEKRQLDEDEKDEASPTSSQSPVKSPHKKGIFAGIISPSLLKGRLKTRSKTMDDEMVRPEAEESKSPGKEKPESPSHSLNWLQALKKKKKSTKETTKEEKKKQPK